MSRRRHAPRIRGESPCEAPHPTRSGPRSQAPRVPGVTIAQACERLGVSRAAVERARRELPIETTPSLAELVLAALSSEGQQSERALIDLEAIADWIDHINRDGCTVADVRRILDGLVDDGALRIQADRWTLARPWP